MAGSDSIDTQSAVGKYLFRQTTGVRLNQDGNTAAENQAVLESIAIAFLLNPQAALSLILRTKNSLQQLISADIEIVDYITSAIGEISNPDTPVSSTSDLVDAQTALIELDRIGRIDTELKAYTRYTSAIGRFLNQQLATSLKRHAKGEFERSGLEAKTDLFNGLGLFTQTHALVSQRTAQLAGAVSDYRSVDLTRIVSTSTLSRVRTSLDRVKLGMDQSNVSKITAAIELLAGAASLQSISNARDLYDPTIAESAGYTIGPEPTSSFFQTSVGPTFSSSASVATLAKNGGASQSFTLPVTGAGGKPFVFSHLNQATFNIPVGYELFVDISPGPAPGSDGITHYAVPLTPGPARTVAQVIADINATFAASGPVASDFDTANNCIIIIGRLADSYVEVLSTGPGVFNSGTNTFTPSSPSAHQLLGFHANDRSTAVGTYGIEFVARFLSTNYGAAFGFVTTQTLDGRVQVTNPDTSLSSSIQVSGTFFSDLGVAAGSYLPQLEALLLKDSMGLTQDPTTLGVLVGSVVHASAFVQTIASFDGTRILFDPAVVLPRTYAVVSVDAPTVKAVQSLMTVLSSYASAFDADLVPLQQVLSPLIATPTLAQVNDALKVFQTIRTKLSTLLAQMAAISVREDQQPAASIASSALSTLEERGLDRALDLLSLSRFSDFFGLDDQTASRSSRFLKSMEMVGNADLSTTTIEEDAPDGNLVQGENSDSLLTGKNVP